MRRKGLLYLLGFILPALVYVQVTSARFEIKVDELASRLLLHEATPQVSLSIENGSDSFVPASIKVQLLDNSNHVVTEASSHQTIKRGSQKLLINLPNRTSELVVKASPNFIWYRLHYFVRPDSSTLAGVDGFISLSKITPDLFELRVSGSRNARPGATYQTVVRAAHPITNEPASGVTVLASITLEVENKKTTLKRSAVTNKQGLATLNFTLPRSSSDDEMDLVVEGRRGFLVASLTEDIDLIDASSALVSTDKPLYQPGQTVHTRALLFNGSHRAISGKSITVRVTDPENTVVFQTDLKTSRFGVASGDWTIPDNIRLGDYSITFMDEHDSDRQFGFTSVKISRYDLPAFSVNVKSDHNYYLPRQDAEVEVKADYLFGRPVTRGHVRLVRETERQWNYREQKYEITEGDKYEGEIGPGGTFRATIKLEADYDELNDRDYSRFIDVPYAAYVTDASTRRTEQRRFNIRISKQPIHVYVIHANNDYYDNPRLPLRFYVTTFYADGSPASCSVTITGPTDDNNKNASLQLSTNRYGLAVVRAFKLPKNTDPSELKIELIAKDRSGKMGSQLESFNFDSRPAIRIETANSLLSPGTPIEATISSSERDLSLTLDVVHDWTVINSQQVSLHNGHATVIVPYRKEFENEVTLAAYAAERNDELFTGSTQTVLYPHDRELKLNLHTASGTYKPGGRAHVSFNTLTADGRKMESALGVVVVDKSVEERVRSDGEFGSGYYGFYRSLLADEQIGSITLSYLQRLNMSQPVSIDLQLAAELLLNSERDYSPQVCGSEQFERSANDAYSSIFKINFNLITTALKIPYDTNGDYPRSEFELRKLLTREGVDFTNLVDPWGVRYRAKFFAEGQYDVFLCESAGPDKKFNTDDDLTVGRLSWPYFRRTGQLIDEVVNNFHQRTKHFIRDYSTLRSELLHRGVNLDQLRDPWNQPYEIDFDVLANQYVIFVKTSAGNNSRWPVVVWDTRTNYFSENESAIDSLLAKRLTNSGRFPENEGEVRTALMGSPVDLDALRDPWNKPYYVTIKIRDFYTDETKMEVRSQNDDTPQERIITRPITAKIITVEIRSAGKDLQVGTVDDFTAGEFSTTVSTQNAGNEPKSPQRTVNFLGSGGAISGVITDAQGASVSNAVLTATQTVTGKVYETKSDDHGRYLFRNVTTGIYELRCSAAGFMPIVITNVLVRSSNVIEVNLTVQPGAISETVTVSAGSVVTMQTSNSTASAKVRDPVVTSVANFPKQQLSTPRLRDYFPETLVWEPQLTTDKKGRANLDFTLADNITTWKMSVIGSTEDGQIGTADAEIRAFQPFFAELDPPSVLTQGDRISLPVVLRNYLDKKQTIDVAVKPESWFQLTGAERKRVEVAAGDFQTQSFDLEAIASIDKGTQRVTAIGSELSDAIEKHVTVHPDGEEKVLTASGLLDRSSSMTMDIPQNTIARSQNLELKIYPNLISHVWESVEGIMRRPYGCAEQTISSSYPSLLILRYLKSTRNDDPIETKAKRYLEAGYQRLLGYQSLDGGFSYWSTDKSDIALTAYAARFLNDAAPFMAVDTGVITSARKYLSKQQQSDGRWKALNWDKTEDVQRTPLLTALVVRSLALQFGRENDTTSDKEIRLAVSHGLEYLKKRRAEIDEPYVIASFALASESAGDNQRALSACARLATLSHPEENGSYWSLETNTPFYGWGLAGRVETSALAIQALAGCRDHNAVSQKQFSELNGRGLLFLLHNKDSYGVWYSTQATINVLEALVSLLNRTPQSVPTNSTSTVQITANGRSIKTIELGNGKNAIAPFIVDLSTYSEVGLNKIELVRTGEAPLASVQLVSRFYVPWTRKDADEADTVRAGDSESLKLETKFDKVSVRIGEEVSCRVKAERIGFRGYGMMLAEIGLPPGVDVDRNSLESAVKDSKWSVNHYDILPDRVVLYVWPNAGGTDFTFKFKPRIAIAAKTAASIVYDYYNPDAKAVLTPIRFVVK